MAGNRHTIRQEYLTFSCCCPNQMPCSLVEYLMTTLSKDKGTVYAFHKKYQYGVRSRIEAQFSRIKRSIGSTLKTHTLSSQHREAIIIANIINRWNSFGQCISVKSP